MVFVPETFAVAADPEPVWGGEQDSCALIARFGGIPRESQASHRVDGTNARAIDCTGTGFVVSIFFNGLLSSATLALGVALYRQRLAQLKAPRHELDKSHTHVQLTRVSLA